MILIKAILLWLGYKGINKILKILLSANSFRYDFGVSKIFILFFIGLEARLFLGEKFDIEFLLIPSIGILTFHVILVLFKEIKHENTKTFDSKFNMIDEVISRYNQHTVYKLAGIKPENINAYKRSIRYYVSVGILFMLITLTVLIYYNYIPNSNFNNLVYCVFAIPSYAIFLRNYNKIVEVFNSEAFQKEVLHYFLYDLLKWFTLFITIIYLALKILLIEKLIFFFNIGVGVILFVLFVYLPWFLAKIRVRNKKMEDDKWLMNKLSRLKNMLHKPIKNDIVEFKNELEISRNNLYDSEKYVEYFLRFYSGLEYEIELDGNFDKDKLDTLKKKLLYDYAIKSVEARERLEILKQTTNLILPLRKYVYVNKIFHVISEIDEMTPDYSNLTNLVNTLMGKITGEQPEDILQDCYALISKGKIELALDKIELSKKVDWAIIAQLKSRYTDLENKKIKGIVSDSDYILNTNKITESILSLLKKVKKDDKAHNKA